MRVPPASPHSDPTRTIGANSLDAKSRESKVLEYPVPVLYLVSFIPIVGGDPVPVQLVVVDGLRVSG